MGVGEAAGKLLLFGEHSAVYGHPAIGVALPLSMRVATTYARGWERPPLPPREGRLIDEAIEALPEVLGRSVEPQRIEISSTLPMSAGFGSSAAFSVALLRALEDHRIGGAPAEHARELWERANRLERVFHGTPSGIDTGMSVLGGVQAFFPSPPALPRTAELTLPACALVVGSLPRLASTAELVGAIGERIAAADQATRTAIDRLGEIAAAVVATLGEQPGRTHLDWLGEQANAAQEELRTLGTSTDELEAALELLRDRGASGAKLSGGGGGGAFFGLFDDADRAAEAAISISTAIGRQLRVFVYAPRSNLSLDPRFL